MTSQDLVGICDEATTYRNGFRYPMIRRNDEKAREEKKVPSRAKEHQLFAESYDTLQKLDRSKRLPFNALWRDKEIATTDPGKSFVKLTALEKPPRVARFRRSESDSRESSDPAINLDEVEAPEMRKIVVDFTYKTTKSQSAEEVWRNWKRSEPELSDTPCEDFANPVSPKLKLIPDLPAGFKGAAKKWDFLQDRVLVDDTHIRPSGKKSKEISEDSEDRDKLIKLIEDSKLRLPYEKLPSSYGGHRTPLAVGVNLEKIKVVDDFTDLTI